MAYIIKLVYYTDYQNKKKLIHEVAKAHQGDIEIREIEITKEALGDISIGNHLIVEESNANADMETENFLKIIDQFIRILYPEKIDLEKLRDKNNKKFFDNEELSYKLIEYSTYESWVDDVYSNIIDEGGEDILYKIYNGIDNSYGKLVHIF